MPRIRPHMNPHNYENTLSFKKNLTFCFGGGLGVKSNTVDRENKISCPTRDSVQCIHNDGRTFLEI